MGRRRLLIRLHLHTRLQEEMYFPCSCSQMDVSQLWPGVTRLCQHDNIVVAKYSVSQQHLLALKLPGLYYARTGARPRSASKRTETGAIHVRIDDSTRIISTLLE